MVAGRQSSAPTVLAIAGSPRRNGNTDLLLEQAISGAAGAGGRVTRLVACDLDISPCRHCGGCLKTGRCVIKDDMQQVQLQLRQTDHLILASPVFFMGVTAQVKSLIDRCQALWSLKYMLKVPVADPAGRTRRGLFVATGGLPYQKERLFGPARETVKSVLHVLEIKYSAELFFPHIDRKGEIARHPTALQDAFRAGKELVEGPVVPPTPPVNTP